MLPYLLQEARNGFAMAGKVNVMPKEEKPQEDEPFLYSSKQVTADTNLLKKWNLFSFSFFSLLIFGFYIL